MVVYLAYGSTANFRFRGPIAKIYISKEREGHGVRSGPRILEIDQVFRKLSRFFQVQSERERYFTAAALYCCSALLQNLVGNSEETKCLEEISRASVD